ncbi:N-acetyl-gamma-glutamyl-phosphate reductase [Salipaludibacillus sp. CF4.18]|uniref:N-acetyl-gamma-glutamyl-phosphate reductase n=1 Tax=Salipaludibacillus sp. CF4.18 TaxID=3373081 RepID=UPI003EE75B43
MIFLKHVAIIGGTGYGAIELVRILHMHKHLQITKIISQSQQGEYLASIYPHLIEFVDTPMEELDINQLKAEIDVVFFATPAGVSKALIPQFSGTNVQCIDLSGDLRLSNSQDYEKWYGGEAAPEETLKEAIYGLPEINKEEIKNARIISNPGCYPTSALLGLIPALQQHIIQPTRIIIDGKTGVSGAGRTPSSMTHFSETNDNLKPYKIGKHQHIPEIEQYLSESVNNKIAVTFTTHLIPMTRGLLCTAYGQLTSDITIDEVIEIYQSHYESHPFVRIRKKDSYPTTKDVYGSNFCDIGLFVDERTNQLIIMSAIDNLVKGAAGQAIQNVNLMNGWDETHALHTIPMYP